MNKRKLGTEYERSAGEYLEKKGCRILEYNFRSRRGEIDIVAKDGRYLVFAEVKYRKDGRAGDPLEAVDRKKQKTIGQTARYYLMVHHLPETVPCRFDVVAFTGTEICHIENAFDMIWGRST